MRDVVFDLLSEKPGQLKASARYPNLQPNIEPAIEIEAASLEELQEEARDALVSRLGAASNAYRVRLRRKANGEGVASNGPRRISEVVACAAA